MVEFKSLAQTTITSAQTVIQQLIVLLGTGKLVYGHEDETEANPKLHWMRKSDRRSAKNTRAREDYEGPDEENKSEYDDNYFEKFDDKDMNLVPQILEC